ncbi:hypothetical protein NVR12_12255, partial [Staphylococcus pseudintermedius]|nr:hypothetical protein [Staphylococcus pseudintermedius]
SDFLQIPLRNGHPCLSLTVPTTKPVTYFHRHVVTDDGRTDNYIISSIYDIDITEVLNYCMYIKNSQIQPFIIFYDDTSLLKIGVDTIDVISASEELIKMLNTKFNF